MHELNERVPHKENIRLFVFAVGYKTVVLWNNKQNKLLMAIVSKQHTHDLYMRERHTVHVVLDRLFAPEKNHNNGLETRHHNSRSL